MDGLIDVHGCVVLPFEYDTLSSPTCGLVRCCRDPQGKYSYLDLSGNVAIPFLYDAASSFDTPSETAWTLMKHGEKRRYTLIDRTGQAINKIPYEDIAFPRDDRIRFTQAGLEGYLDRSGEVVVRPRFDAATDFSSTLAAVRLASGQETYRYIDQAGNIKLGPYHGAVAYWCEFNNGLALLQGPKGSPTRYIDPKGELVIELGPELKGSPFFGGFAVVWDLDKSLCGYIDTEGRYLISPSLTDADSFSGGYALVKLQEEEFYIDTRGNRVSCPTGYRVTTNPPSCSRMCIVDRAGKWGVADLEGNIVINPIYKLINNFSDNCAVAVLP